VSERRWVLVFVFIAIVAAVTVFMVNKAPP
jgi:hypothetical protein